MIGILVMQTCSGSRIAFSLASLITAWACVIGWAQLGLAAGSCTPRTYPVNGTIKPVRVLHVSDLSLGLRFTL